MENQFDIQPYVGVGALRFGMKKEEVEKILGPVDKLRKNIYLNETKEFRLDNGLQTVYSEPDCKLVEISFYANIPSVVFGGINVFLRNGKEIVKYLMEADDSPFETVGILVFLKLGISMTGFLQDDEPGQKSISVFNKGRWDDDMEDFEPFALR